MLPFFWRLLFLVGVLGLTYYVILLSLGDFKVLSKKILGSLAGFVGGIWYMPQASTGLIIGWLKAGAGLLRYVDQG